MSLDLDKMPQAERRNCIKLGEQFGSQDTLDQANQTLKACGTHAATIAKFGFTAKQAKRLEEARDGLVEAGVGRDAAKGSKKVNSQAYKAAMNQGLTARITARTVLQAVAEDLAGSDDAAAVNALHNARAALMQTPVAPADADPLANQLTTLVSALKQKDVAGAAADQGGPEAAAEAEAAIAALRKADQEAVGVRGTPVETAQLDLLDGIIVQLVRRARRAAVAAGKQFGNPALAEAFKLDKLYRSRAGGPPQDDEPGDEPADPADGASKPKDG
jgi:hypothetical protein